MGIRELQEQHEKNLADIRAGKVLARDVDYKTFQTRHSMCDHHWLVTDRHNCRACAEIHRADQEKEWRNDALKEIRDLSTTLRDSEEAAFRAQDRDRGQARDGADDVSSGSSGEGSTGGSVAGVVLFALVLAVAGVAGALKWVASAAQPLHEVCAVLWPWLVGLAIVATLAEARWGRSRTVVRYASVAALTLAVPTTLVGLAGGYDSAEDGLLRAVSAGGCIVAGFAFSVYVAWREFRRARS